MKQFVTRLAYGTLEGARLLGNSLTTALATENPTPEDKEVVTNLQAQLQDLLGRTTRVEGVLEIDLATGDVFRVPKPKAKRRAKPKAKKKAAPKKKPAARKKKAVRKGK